MQSYCGTCELLHTTHSSAPFLPLLPPFRSVRCDSSSAKPNRFALKRVLAHFMAPEGLTWLPVGTWRSGAFPQGTMRLTPRLFLLLCGAVSLLSSQAQEGVLLLDYEFERDEFSSLRASPFTFGGGSFTIEGK